MTAVHAHTAQHNFYTVVPDLIGNPSDRVGF